VFEYYSFFILFLCLNIKAAYLTRPNIKVGNNYIYTMYLKQWKGILLDLSFPSTLV